MISNYFLASLRSQHIRFECVYGLIFLFFTLFLFLNGIPTGCGKSFVRFTFGLIVQDNKFLPEAGKFNDLSVLLLMKIPRAVRSEVFSVKTRGKWGKADHRGKVNHPP